MSERIYIAIDLKSFYASVECAERGLDPLTTNLVVADESRTEKTICLAVSPSLKALGIPGRARLFEVVQAVKRANEQRRMRAPGKKLEGASSDANVLRASPTTAIEYIVAPPRMAYYLEYSTHVYEVYLKYVAPEDILVYSIDEVFIDATNYLSTYDCTAHELAMTMIREVLAVTGVTATAGVGTNLYLAKIAMDIVAKKMPPDKDGVRIAELDETSYRKKLWDHRPLTSFWRVGRGYARRLEAAGMHTMGDVARCSINNEDILYDMFGVNAELLIDHAWGWEPCTIADAKSYKPETRGVCSGQVLSKPYTFDMARAIVIEMTDQLALDLTSKRLVTDQLVLTVGYDVENLTDPERAGRYKGEIKTDFYGRRVPKHANGVGNIGRRTASSSLLTETALGIFDRVVDKELLVRRITLSANRLVDENDALPENELTQLDLFTDVSELDKKEASLKREKRRQEALVNIKGRFGKNAILKGVSFEDGATARERNNQIGGHKA